MAFWSQNDAYVIHDEDDDSSDDVSSSSEDEINVILHGTPEQKRKLKRLQEKHKEVRGHGERRKSDSSSSGDEFEKEMNAELDQHVSFLERNRVPDTNEGQICPMESEQIPQDSKTEADDFYDEIYFDSDDEGNDEHHHPNDSGKHAVISNDDLLYDPTMDDKDQKWVDKQRRKHNNTSVTGRTSSQKRKKPGKVPTSDALLDCPACLTTLCLDCQRHETYKHQYRAMFVMNCQVDSTQMLQCPEQMKGKKRKKKNQESGPVTDGAVGSDLFNPVKCTECNTVVGVIDTDEVYHFFNVLASHT